MRKRRKKRLLPWVTLTMFTIFFLCIINFDRVSLSLTEGAYEQVDCRVTKQTYDGLLAFFPRIEVKYTYDGKDIDSEKVMYSGIFFNDKVDNAKYYVNKFSNKDFLVIQPYGSSWVNWILTFNLIVFVSIFSYNLVENIRYVKVKKNSKDKC